MNSKTTTGVLAAAMVAMAMFISGCATLEETISRADGGNGDAQYTLYKAYSAGDFKGQKVEKKPQVGFGLS